MSLNARALALQGFLLTPIAMAVQGLIAVLVEVEEKNQVYGRGRKKSAPRAKRLDDLTREEIEAQWDLLETRLRAQAKDPATVANVAVATHETHETHETVAGITGFTGSGEVANSANSANSAMQRRKQEDEFLLLLCL